MTSPWLAHAPHNQQPHQRVQSIRLGAESLPGGVVSDARDEALVTARVAAVMGQEA